MVNNDEKLDNGTIDVNDLSMVGLVCYFNTEFVFKDL